MIFSRPSNAPPTMNRMFEVLIWMKSWGGCLRPPCVCNRERHVEDARECARECRLTRTGRPDQQDVRLLEVKVSLCRCIDALVVVVYRDREHTLRALLPDDVFIELCDDLLWRAHMRA